MLNERKNRYTETVDQKKVLINNNNKKKKNTNKFEIASTEMKKFINNF